MWGTGRLRIHEKGEGRDRRAGEGAVDGDVGRGNSVMKNHRQEEDVKVQPQKV